MLASIQSEAVPKNHFSLIFMHISESICYIYKGSVTFSTLNFGVVLGMSVSSGQEEHCSRMLKHTLGHWTKHIMQTFISVSYIKWYMVVKHPGVGHE